MHLLPNLWEIMNVYEYTCAQYSVYSMYSTYDVQYVQYSMYSMYSTCMYSVCLCTYANCQYLMLSTSYQIYKTHWKVFSFLQMGLWNNNDNVNNNNIWGKTGQP